MSSDRQVLPKRVRYNQSQQQHVIYENADNIRDDQRTCQLRKGGGQTLQHPPVHRRSVKRAALCLGVLCLLMMSGIIVLSILYFSVTSENEHLQRKFNNLNNNYNQSQNDTKQLEDKFTDMVAKNSKLQEEVKKLKVRTKECPEGWTRFGCSCYFKSTEKKIWPESRKECVSNGADLVIINSKDEQDFVTKLNMNKEFWIGLRTTENKQTSTGYKWEWVDNSPLGETFWATVHKDPTGLYVASCCNEQGQWRESGYSDSDEKRSWICEK